MAVLRVEEGSPHGRMAHHSTIPSGAAASRSSHQRMLLCLPVILVRRNKTPQPRGWDGAMGAGLSERAVLLVVRSLVQS